jgi:hypothetical protein
MEKKSFIGPFVKIFLHGIEVEHLASDLGPNYTLCSPQLHRRVAGVVCSDTKEGAECGEVDAEARWPVSLTWRVGLSNRVGFHIHTH